MQFQPDSVEIEAGRTSYRRPLLAVSSDSNGRRKWTDTSQPQAWVSSSMYHRTPPASEDIKSSPSHFLNLRKPPRISQPVGFSGTLSQMWENVPPTSRSYPAVCLRLLTIVNNDMCKTCRFETRQKWWDVQRAKTLLTLPFLIYKTGPVWGNH